MVGDGTAVRRAASLAVTLLQTPRPGGSSAIALSLVGGTVVVWSFLAVAFLPARAIGWPTRAR